MKQTQKKRQRADVINAVRKYKERNYQILQKFGFELCLDLELELGLGLEKELLLA